MKEHIFIPKGDEMVIYSDIYGTPVKDTFVSLDRKEAVTRDVLDFLFTKEVPPSDVYNEVIIYDRNDGVKISVKVEAL